MSREYYHYPFGHHVCGSPYETLNRFDFPVVIVAEGVRSCIDTYIIERTCVRPFSSISF